MCYQRSKKKGHCLISSLTAKLSLKIDDNDGSRIAVAKFYCCCFVFYN